MNRNNVEHIKEIILQQEFQYLEGNRLKEYHVQFSKVNGGYLICLLTQEGGKHIQSIPLPLHLLAGVETGKTALQRGNWSTISRLKNLFQRTKEQFYIDIMLHDRNILLFGIGPTSDTEVIVRNWKHIIRKHTQYMDKWMIEYEGSKHCLYLSSQAFSIVSYDQKGPPTCSFLWPVSSLSNTQCRENTVYLRINDQNITFKAPGYAERICLELETAKKQYSQYENAQPGGLNRTGSMENTPNIDDTYLHPKRKTTDPNSVYSREYSQNKKYQSKGLVRTDSMENTPNIDVSYLYPKRKTTDSGSVYIREYIDVLPENDYSPQTDLPGGYVALTTSKDTKLDDNRYEDLTNSTKTTITSNLHGATAKYLPMEKCLSAQKHTQGQSALVQNAIDDSNNTHKSCEYQEHMYMYGTTKVKIPKAYQSTHKGDEYQSYSEANKQSNVQSKESSDEGCVNTVESSYYMTPAVIVLDHITRGMSSPNLLHLSERARKTLSFMLCPNEKEQDLSNIFNTTDLADAVGIIESELVTIRNCTDKMYWGTTVLAYWEYVYKTYGLGQFCKLACTRENLSKIFHDHERYDAVEALSRMRICTD